MFGSQHSCLEFRFRVRVRTLVLHVLSCCVSVRSQVRSAVHSSVHLFCVLWCCMQFMLCLVLCGTPIVFFIGCMLSCCHVLCEHVAFVLVFCVPCALMPIVLTPPILLPDYWFIFRNCCPSLPSSFALFIISLCLKSCLQSCSSSYLPQLYPVPALPFRALPFPACQTVSPLRVVLFVCFVLFLINKAHSPAQLSPRLIPSPQP